VPYSLQLQPASSCWLTTWANSRWISNYLSPINNIDFIYILMCLPKLIL
jgi:hypothetical protein